MNHNDWYHDQHSNVDNMSEPSSCLSDYFLKWMEGFYIAFAVWWGLRVDSPLKVLSQSVNRWRSERKHLEKDEVSGLGQTARNKFSYKQLAQLQGKLHRLHFSQSTRSATALDQLWSHIWWSFLTKVGRLPSSARGIPSWRDRKSRWSSSSMRRENLVACEF